MSDSGAYLKIVLVSVTVGGALIFSAWKRRRRARLIQDTPRSKIESAAQGLVEVEGFAWSNNENFLKGVSGFDVVYYNFQLQRAESRGSGKNRRTEWVTVFSRVHDETFYICDPTGLAIVDPKSSEIECSGDGKTSWNRLSKEKRELVVREIVNVDIPNFPPSNFLFGLFSNSFRIVEKEIRVGSPIHVTGNLTALSDPPLKARELGLTRFVSQTMDQTSRALKNVTRLLDQNGDSKISGDEARAGYAHAAQIARARSKQEKFALDVEQEFPVFGILQHSPHHPLIIGDDHEARLVERLHSGNTMRMLAGSALVTVGISISLFPFVPVAEIFSVPGSTSLRLASRGERVSSKNKVANPAAETSRGRAPAESEQSDDDLRAELAQLHQSCLKHAVTDACRTLLQGAEKYRLSKQYMDYYTTALGTEKGTK